MSLRVRPRSRQSPQLLESSATQKLGFHLWYGATANWERSKSFTCKRRAALRINKENSCELQITQLPGPRLPRHPSVSLPGLEDSRVPRCGLP